MECPECKSQNVRPHGGPVTLVIGLVMWIGGAAFGKSPGAASSSGSVFLYSFLGIASAFGIVITLMAVFGMFLGKNTCKNCKCKWR